MSHSTRRRRLAICITALAVALAAAPAAIPFWLIHLYGVNVPMWDQWDTARMFIAAHEGHLLAGLFAQHNEHRMFFPQLAVYLLARPDWDTRREMFFAWVLAGASSLGMLGFIAKTMRPRRPARVLLTWLVCNLLIFEPQQTENWFWGIGIANLMPMVWVTAALLIASTRWTMGIRVAAALPFALAAAFSSGNGILAWPLAGLLLAWSANRAELAAKWPWLLAWVVAAAGSTLLYFHGYVEPAHGSINPYFPGPIMAAHYMAAFVGNFAVGTNPDQTVLMATVIGAALLAGYAGAVAYGAIMARRGDAEFCRHAIVWIAVGGFAVLSALLGAIFRGRFDAIQAISPRYISFGLYLPLSLMVLVPMIARHAARPRGAEARDSSPAFWITAMVLGTAIATLVVGGYGHAIDDASGWIRNNRLAGRTAMMLIRAVDDERDLAYLHPEPAVVMSMAQKLDALGYFRPPLLSGPDAEEARDPDPDAAEGQLEMLRPLNPATMLASGWAVNPKTGRPADAVVLTYQNARGEPTIFAVAQTGQSRPEVAALLQHPDEELCGWAATFSPADIPANLGHSTIAAWALNLDTGKTSPLAGAQNLEIEP